MHRAIWFGCSLGVSAITLAASISDDMIEPSERVLRFKIAKGDLDRFGDAVETYAHSIRLRGLRHKNPKLSHHSIVAGYDQPMEPLELMRAIFVLYNSETECAGVLVRVWDDEQTDMAVQMAEQAKLFLRDRFERPLEVMQGEQCELTF